MRCSLLPNDSACLDVRLVDDRRHIRCSSIRAGGSTALICKLPVDSLQLVLEAEFENTHITTSGPELAGFFPLAKLLCFEQCSLSTTWNMFLRGLCASFADTLLQLTVIKCGLTELPRELASLRSLRTLHVCMNDILWVHHSIAWAMPALEVLNLSFNERLPIKLRGYWSVGTRNTLHALCTLDRSNRYSIVCWMGVLRHRLHMTRDVVELLGRSLWGLRWQIVHKE